MKFIIIFSLFVAFVACTPLSFRYVGDVDDDRFDEDHLGVPLVEGGCTREEIPEKYRNFCMNYKCIKKDGIISDNAYTEKCWPASCIEGIKTYRSGNTTATFPDCCPSFTCNSPRPASDFLPY